MSESFLNREQDRISGRLDLEHVQDNRIEINVQTDIPNTEKNLSDRDGVQTLLPLIQDQTKTEDLDNIHSKTYFETTKSLLNRNIRSGRCVWQVGNTFLAILALVGIIILFTKLNYLLPNSDSDSDSKENSSKVEPNVTEEFERNVFGMFEINQTLLADHGQLVWKKKKDFTSTVGVEASDSDPCVIVSFDGFYKAASQITFKFSANTGVFNAAHALSTKKAPAFKENIMVKSSIQTFPIIFSGNSYARQLQTSYLSTLVRLNSGEKVCVQTNQTRAIYVSPIDNMFDVIRILPL